MKEWKEDIQKPYKRENTTMPTSKKLLKTIPTINKP